MTTSSAMSSLSYAFFFSTGLLIALINLLSVLCMENSLLSPPEGMLLEDKTRLGSTPPSCHYRCHQCNPCTAVQVPTPPVGSGRVRVETHPSDEQPFYSNQYSDYKPLGWKCRCGNRIYDP